MSQVSSAERTSVKSPGRNPDLSAASAASENNATSPAVGASDACAAPKPKLRSCVVCRTRKVRCDKRSPCSNCRRANIPCVFPSTDRPPRWARRLERVANDAANRQASQAVEPGVDQVMGRLHALEKLVKELNGQLEQARAAANTTNSTPSASRSPESSSQDRDGGIQYDETPVLNASNVQKQFGRLVLNDSNRSRYISSGFWSRVIDEVLQSSFKLDSDRVADVSFRSLMVLKWILVLLPWTILIAQMMVLLRARLHPHRSLIGHHQSAMHSCLAITCKPHLLIFETYTLCPRRYHSFSTSLVKT